MSINCSNLTLLFYLRDICFRFTIYLFFQINKKFKYVCLTFRSPLRKPLSKTMNLKAYRYLRQLKVRELANACVQIQRVLHVRRALF